MTITLQTYGRGNRGRGLETAVGMKDPEYSVWTKEGRARIFDECEPWTAEYRKAERIEKVAQYVNRK